MSCLRQRWQSQPAQRHSLFNKLFIRGDGIQNRLTLIAYDRMSTNLYSKYILFNCSLTMDILERLPGFPERYDLTTLWCNPNLTFEFAKTYIGTSRYWMNICTHSCIHLHHVIDHPDLGWDWHALSRNKNITMKDVIDHPDLPWIWGFAGLSSNPSIRAIDMILHADKPWYWFVLSNKADVTLELVKKHWEMPWNWKELSMHPNITYQQIMDHPELPWELVYMCKNPNIMTIDMVLKHPDWPWDWGLLSSHPNIKVQDVIEHLNLGWKWKCICANPNITMSDVLALDAFNVAICWRSICMNPNIDPCMIIEFWKLSHSVDDIDVDWHNLSQRAPLDYILEHPDLPWDRYGMCMNKTLFKPTLREIREWWASKVICKAIFESWTNPAYMLCQNRIRKWANECL